MKIKIHSYLLSIKIWTNLPVDWFVLLPSLNYRNYTSFKTGWRICSVKRKATFKMNKFHSYWILSRDTDPFSFVNVKYRLNILHTIKTIDLKILYKNLFVGSEKCLLFELMIPWCIAFLEKCLQVDCIN